MTATWAIGGETDAQRGILAGLFPRVQDAFKDLMIHGVLQFALRIAFRCVLHRYGSRDIHRMELALWLYSDSSCRTSAGSVTFSRLVRGMVAPTHL